MTPAYSLRAITMPLPPAHFAAVGSALAVASAGYCVAHGLVAGSDVDPPLSLAWGAAETLPWWCAWEGMKRTRAASKRWLFVPALLIAALTIASLLDFALSATFFPDNLSIPELFYSRAPVALVLGIAAVLLETPRPTVTAPNPDARGSPPAGTMQLRIPTRQGIVTLAPADIDYIRAAGNYVELVAGARTLLMRATLHELAERMDAAGFIRIHRGVLVNRDRVACVGRSAQGRRVLRLHGGTELPVGRQFCDRVRDVFPDSRL